MRRRGAVGRAAVNKSMGSVRLQLADHLSICCGGIGPVADSLGTYFPECCGQKLSQE
jgi:hypothetical protein